MGKVFCLIGKSASGKNTIYDMIMDHVVDSFLLKPIILYTDRPIRVGETNGFDYNFVNKDTMDFYIKSNRCIESRTYNTAKGIFRYATLNDNIDLVQYNYLIISTLESYLNIATYFGNENVVPIYIYSDDKERLIRSIKREEKEQSPNYTEICKRFLRDEYDLSEDHLDHANIIHRVENKSIDDTFRSVYSIIEKYIKVGEVL